MSVYLDHNATTPLRPEARAALAGALDSDLANPSSVHRWGRSARAALETARRQVAGLTGVSTEAITFTSGATEAAAQAIRSAAGQVDRILMSAVEHDCIRAHVALADRPVTEIPVTADGTLDLGALKQALLDSTAQNERALLCVMLVNNETGVVQPVAEAAACLREKTQGWVLCDAVQGPGKRPPLEIQEAVAASDYALLSAHKFGGPAGAGVLIARNGAPVERQVHGGGQEFGRRAGTENLLGIIALGAAAEAAASEDLTRIERLRDRLETEIQAAAPGAEIFGAKAPRAVNTICLRLPGVTSETVLMALDLEGIGVSAGAACSSGKMATSHVIRAMTKDEQQAREAVRLSLGWTTTEKDITAAAAAWGRVAPRLIGRQQRPVIEDTRKPIIEDTRKIAS